MIKKISKHPVQILLFGVLFLTGCASAISAVAYVVKGYDQDPNCKLLMKGEHKVVVVSRAQGLQYQCDTVPEALSQYVSYLIGNNTKNKKLRMIDQRKVNDWFDRRSGKDIENFLDIGEDLNADYVVGIDVEYFSIYDSGPSNLYRGTARVKVSLYDCKTKEEKHNRSFPRIVYPPNAAITRTDKDLVDFRRDFVEIVASHIASEFHPHDPRKIERIDADAL